MIARFVAVVAGVWLMFAPAVLDYGGSAATNDRIFGPIGASIAFVAIWEVTRPLRWGTLPVGCWLVLAPLVLGYDDAAPAVSSAAAGAALAVTAFFGGATESTFAGGWTEIRPAAWATTSPPPDEVD
jgi:hypothetical protein